MLAEQPGHGLEQRVGARSPRLAAQRTRQVRVSRDQQGRRAVRHARRAPQAALVTPERRVAAAPAEHREGAAGVQPMPGGVAQDGHPTSVPLRPAERSSERAGARAPTRFGQRARLASQAWGPSAAVTSAKSGLRRCASSSARKTGASAASSTGSPPPSRCSSSPSSRSRTGTTPTSAASSTRSATSALPASRPRPPAAPGYATTARSPTSVIQSGTTVDYASLVAKAGNQLPPTSGPRDANLLPDTPAFIARSAAPHPERAIGNLDHGYVIVWYDNDLPAAQVKLLQAASSHEQPHAHRPVDPQRLPERPARRLHRLGPHPAVQDRLGRRPDLLRRHLRRRRHRQRLGFAVGSDPQRRRLARRPLRARTRRLPRPQPRSPRPRASAPAASPTPSASVTVPSASLGKVSASPAR